MARKIGCALLVLVVLAGFAAFSGYRWLDAQTSPTALGEPFYVRYNDSVPLQTVLNELQAKGVVRNADAMALYARWKKWPDSVSSGTYQLRPGLSRNDLRKALQDPVHQMVRLRENFWAARNAKILEDHDVASGEEYLALVKTPSEFAGEVSFPLPVDTLEGYLYPDTYDLPPLLGARETILRQLKAFEEKVYEPLGKPSNIHELVTIGSMVQLEVYKDEERPVVAGVIKNRIERKMPLQIDATILYGLQEWRTLTYDDYRNVESPFNTYKFRGLPPGPICSPSKASVAAAAKPAEHNFLYYVAHPDGSHMFSSTYDQHLANIGKRRRAMAEADS